MKIRGVLFGVVAGVSILFLMGCPKSEEKVNPEVGKTPVGGAPTTPQDALKDPHVPDSVKAQIKGMQNQGGGAQTR